LNGAQWHLLINHLPVFGLVFGLFLQLAAIYRNQQEWKSVALLLYVVTALGTIPAYMTGDPAEHVVRDMPEVDRDEIDTHQDWATASLIAIEALGIASLAGLYLAGRGNRASVPVIQGCIALAVLGFSLVAWTAHVGGRINHRETRPGFVVPPRSPRKRRQPSAS
jgi:uncharacterized membrane protein